ncbi:hypothetical protein DL98DRAFT_592036 [Cadophora sp. DSE1049]|nr:hypothetical protein DL98DRAFT_592036 [Cadophora sp. DSE1049]
MASEAPIRTGQRSFSIIHAYGKFWHYLTSSPNDFRWPGIDHLECAPYTSYNNDIALCYVVKFSVVMLLVPVIYLILIHFMHENAIRSRVADLERRLLAEIMKLEPKEREKKIQSLCQKHHVKLRSDKGRRNTEKSPLVPSPEDV